MSGKNHAYGHYHAYDRTLADGDFLILDAGPAYRNYHVDISTTFPASGRFTPRQRELYEDLVLFEHRPQRIQCRCGPRSRPLRAIEERR